MVSREDIMGVMIPVWESMEAAGLGKAGGGGLEKVRPLNRGKQERHRKSAFSVALREQKEGSVM